MQVKVEKTGGLERRMTVVVPSPAIEEAFEQKLAERARNARLNGFRPGKTPIKEVRRRFGKALRMEAAITSMETGFQTAVREHSLNLASAPAFQMGALQPNVDFEFTATFEVLPEIPFGDFGQVQVEQPVAEVKDADVDDMVETLRANHKQWHVVERPAQKGDRATADLDACGDAEFKGDGIVVLVGEAFPMPGIADAAAGMSAGETKRVASTFPEFMADEALRGQDAEFDLTVKEVAEARLPALDDAFFAALGITEGGETRFRQEVRSDLETRLAVATRDAVRGQVLTQLVAMHEFDLPQALVSREREALDATVKQRLGQPDGEQSPEFGEALTRQAERRVRTGLVVNAIVEREGMQPDGAKVRERIEEISRGYEHPEQVVAAYYRDENLLGQVESVVLEDQVVAHVLSLAQVQTVERSYQDVLNAPAPKEEGEAPPSEAA